MSHETTCFDTEVLVCKKEVILIQICVGAWAEATSAAQTFNWPALTRPCPHLVVMPGSLVWAGWQGQHWPTHSICFFYVFSFPLYIVVHQVNLGYGLGARLVEPRFTMCYLMLCEDSISGGIPWLKIRMKRPSVFSKGRATPAKSGWSGCRHSLHSSSH